MSLRDLQTRLKTMGFDPGPIDGRWGTRTENAINVALDWIRPQPDWVKAGQLVAQQPFAQRTINEIVVHCTATSEGAEFTAEDIRRWHKERGWRDIGYHYVVRIDGTVEPGRPEAEVGAHVLWHNEGTLGVVYVGGVGADGQPKDTRTEVQKVALAAIVRALCVKYPKITKVTGHNAYAAKACPSFDVRTDPLAKIPNEW